VDATSPTYWTEVSGSDTVYNCIYCAEQDMEHHSIDFEMFTMHMAQRHDGRMLEGTAPAGVMAARQAEAAKGGPPEHAGGPHGAPPGQSGEHPDHPHEGGPPGQSGEHPEEPDEPPHPAHLPAEPAEGV
jgi:hypothetical protein